MPANEVTTDYVLRAGKYVSGARAVTGATDSTAKAIAGVRKNLREVGGHLDTLREKMGGVRAASISLLAGIAIVGYGFMQAGAQMDSLEAGLATVAGSSKETRAQLKRLEEVATLPGLGFREAVQGSTRLQAAGFSAKEAEAAMKAFGNALASVGAGKSDLDGILLALTQIVSKGSVSAEEINQIAERVPQIRRVMQAVFGTADTEALQKQGIEAKRFVNLVVAELGRLPQAVRTSRTDFEDWEDATFRASASVGRVLNKEITPALRALTSRADELNRSGAIEQATKGIARLLGGKDLGDGLAKGLDSAVAGMRWIGDNADTVQRAIKIIGGAVALSFAADKIKGILEVAAAIKGIASGASGAAKGVGAIVGGAAANAGASAAGTAAGSAAGGAAAGGAAAGAAGRGFLARAGTWIAQAAKAAAAAVLGAVSWPVLIGAAVALVAGFGARWWAQRQIEAQNTLDEQDGSDVHPDVIKARKRWAEKRAAAEARRARMEELQARATDASYRSTHGGKSAEQVKADADRRRRFEELETARRERAAEHRQDRDRSRSSIVGGGDLARLGVTPVEMALRSKGIRAGGNFARQLALTVDALASMALAQYGEMQAGQARQGSFGR
jgi:tape measure domain-containing protein